MLSVDQLALELDAGLIGLPLRAISGRIGLTTRADWRTTRQQQCFIAAIDTEVASMNL